MDGTFVVVATPREMVAPAQPRRGDASSDPLIGCRDDRQRRGTSRPDDPRRAARDLGRRASRAACRARNPVCNARALQLGHNGWSQPLESYMAALENAGLAITSLREPVPDTADKGSHMARWKKIPLFLWLKAIPLQSNQ